MVPPTRRILPTITYSDPTAGEPPQDVYRLFRGDSSPYTSICSKWRRILSAVVVIWRFVAPLSSSMAYTNAHDPSPTPLPLNFKNILLYVEKVAMMGPPTLQLPLYSGQWRVYMLLLWWGTHHRVERAYTLIISAPLQKGTYDVHYRTPNIQQQSIGGLMEEYKYLQFTWGNPFTVIICRHIHLKHVSFE